MYTNANMRTHIYVYMHIHTCRRTGTPEHTHTHRHRHIHAYLHCTSEFYFSDQTCPIQMYESIQICMKTHQESRDCVAVCCSVLQCVAVCCSVKRQKEYTISMYLCGQAPVVERLINKRINTLTHTHTYTHTRTHTHTWVMRVRTLKHTYTHTRTHTHVLSHTNTHTNSLSHTHNDTHTHTHIHTHAHTYTHNVVRCIVDRDLIRDSLMYINVLYVDPCGEVGGWGRDPKKCTGRDWGMGLVPFNETYAPSLSTIYDGA